LLHAVSTAITPWLIAQREMRMNKIEHEARRRFLKHTGHTALAASALGVPGLARAAGTWGDVPSGVWSTAPNLRILEIHLLGGMAPFESFYFRPAAAVRTRGFDAEVAALNWNSMLAACSGTPPGPLPAPPPSPPIASQFLANDENGKAVHLGPFAAKLWPAHIKNRTRVVVLRHDLMPHEAAIPFVMTGLRIGRPTQASMGSAIAQRYRALDEAAAAPFRVAPYSYGLLPEDAFAPFNNALFATMGQLGMHTGASKPLVLRVGSLLSTFFSQLGRPGMTPAANALLDNLRAQYRDWLRFQGSALPTALVRSKAFRDYDLAVANLFDAPSLASFFATVPQTIVNGTSCASETAGFNTDSNITEAALKAAVFLLTRADPQGARYVHVVDTGVNKRGGLPYDVHSVGHATDTGSNLWNTLAALTRLIKDPANPTPQDADKLDLNNTMIVINTEFGRTPFKSFGNSPSAASKGRDHWPDAFCNVMIGGPIATPKVLGSISDAAGAGGVADISYTPTDVRAAQLLAMNINPFEAENYQQGALSSPFATAADHTAAMVALRQKFFD
jgi:hypothetical protein